MRVFIMGGTGSIGTAVLEELRARSHAVTALSRSEASDRKITRHGATALRGDLREPGAWVDEALDHQAIVQVATDWQALITDYRSSGVFAR